MKTYAKNCLKNFYGYVLDKVDVKIVTSEKLGILNVECNGMKLEIPVKPPAPSNAFI